MNFNVNPVSWSAILSLLVSSSEAVSLCFKSKIVSIAPYSVVGDHFHALSYLGDEVQCSIQVGHICTESSHICNLFHGDC